MAPTTQDDRRRAPNVGEPTGLLLGEAFLHLSEVRLLRLLRTPRGAALTIAALVGFYLWEPSWGRGLTAAAPATYLSVVVAYLCWYGRFVARNRREKPLCPQCTSRMWQVSCARCREPVPPLALWLRGAFLSRCPCCGLRLSCSGETLRAWCSTCSRTRPRPDLLYRKPTHVIVWITPHLPEEVSGGWESLAPQRGGELAFYHEGDAHSASLLFVRDDFRSADPPIKEHLLNRTRLLLISGDVPSENAQQIRGHFKSSWTIHERV